jgi:ATP-dependent DNA helicase RecG
MRNICASAPLGDILVMCAGISTRRPAESVKDTVSAADAGRVSAGRPFPFPPEQAVNDASKKAEIKNAPQSRFFINLINFIEYLSFRLLRFIFQELTFTRTAKEFADMNLAFEHPQQQSLGIIGENGMYTNLGLLLSEQCQHTVKVAVFEGTSKSVFKSRKEFGGSLIQQLYDVVEYVDYFNFVQAKIGKVRRVERRDYPTDAIREAVLNMLAHREYALSASSFVNVYDDRLEFLSVGGLVPGISLDAALSGVSHTRNEGIAKIFYRLELVEAYGTGIIRIMDGYADCERKPEIHVTDTSFKLVLPNTRYGTANAPPDGQERIIMALIERDGYVTAKSLGEVLGLGATRIYNILTRMVDAGRLAANSNGHRIDYRSRTR